MIVPISRRELVAAWRVLAMGANWGGSEDVLLAQGELWTTCRLAEFQPLTTVDEAGNESPTAINLGALANDPEPYELSPNAIQVLRQFLGAKGQDPLIGLSSFAALTRIRTALAAAQPK